MASTSNSPRAPKKPRLLILILMSSIGPFGDTEYTPALPSIAKDMNTSYASVEWTMTSYLLGYAISQLFYGPLSDKFGRRPIMMLGTLMFIIGSLVCIFSFSIEVLIAGRFLQALGACAGNVLSPAIVRDAFTEEERPRTYAKIMMAYALGPVLGPIIGSILITFFTWHSNFILLLILGITLLFFVHAMLIETNFNKNPLAMRPKQFFNNYGAIFKDPYCTAYMVLLGATFGVVYSCLVEAPALVEYVRQVSPFAARLSLPETFTLITFCVGGGYITGSFIAKVTSIRHTPNQIILAGILAMLVGNLILMYFAYTNFVNIATMLGPIAGIFIGVGMISPMAMANAMIPFNNIAGSASAMIGFIQMTLSALSTLLISFFHAKSATPMPNTFIFLIVFALLVHVCGVSLRPNRQRHYV